MIPILFEAAEPNFASNGLGRLRDTIECVVSEERNGLYECEFSYPLDGANFDLIKPGRIIGVAHDESEDIQPFDIVSYSRPINGVVTFHCTHISYRQSYLTVTGDYVASLEDAFELLEYSTPVNPFSYETDISSTAYMSVVDGTPLTVRSLLGGMEGSILDIYGGEYEWDKWRVILHKARGETRDLTIRYGINMLSYNEEYSIEGAYKSCIPYWTDGTTKVIGSKQTGSGQTVTGRDETVPVDVSDRFDGQPTKAQVEAAGLSWLRRNQPNLPVQNIKVDFVRLKNLGYPDLAHLEQCKLCDTIKVYFPGTDATGNFKVVKISWDVLRERYQDMELGQLSVTLSQALGLSK